MRYPMLNIWKQFQMGDEKNQFGYFGEGHYLDNTSQNKLQPIGTLLFSSFNQLWIRRGSDSFIPRDIGIRHNSYIIPCKVFFSSIPGSCPVSCFFRLSFIMALAKYWHIGTWKKITIFRKTFLIKLNDMSDSLVYISPNSPLVFIW